MLKLLNDKKYGNIVQKTKEKYKKIKKIKTIIHGIGVLNVV